MVPIGFFDVSNIYPAKTPAGFKSKIKENNLEEKVNAKKVINIDEENEESPDKVMNDLEKETDKELLD